MAGIDLDEFQFGETLRGDREGDRVFDRFTLRRCIGRGGMGVVWLAYDERLSRDVVLKFIPELLRFDEAAIAELKAETKICLELSHPNIVRVYDFFSDATRVGICMEYVEGETLSKLRIARPNKVFEPSQLGKWVVQIIDALVYAHETARLVHRDLKPENILINRAGDVKIMDFGIARSLTDSLVRVTMQSTSLGTLAYMSPQQAAGHPPQPSDDLYALGSTLYEMLTGKPPFYSGDIATQLRGATPPSIAERRAQFGIVGEPIPPEWENAISACLAKDPGKRPQSARDLGMLLGLVGAGDSLRLEAATRTTGPQSPAAAMLPRTQVVVPSVAHTPPDAVTRKTTTQPHKKRSLAPTLAAFLLALGLGAGGGYYWFGRTKRTDATAAGDPSKTSASTSASAPARPATHITPKPEPASTSTPTQVTQQTTTNASPATPSVNDKPAQPAGPLRVPSQYKTIQAAIDAAQPGQRIEVAPGTYREALKFKNGLTLLGQGDPSPVVISDGLGGSVLFVNECRGGEVRNMIFEHDEGPSSRGKSPVVMIRNSSVKFEGCRIRRGVAEGVVISGGGDVEFVRTDSELNGLDGFKAEARARPVLKECVSVRNGGSGFVALGIQTTVTLENCRARLNGEDGLSVEQSAAAKVRSSSFEGNTRCGAYLKDRGTQGEFLDSTLTKNERDNFHVLDSATLRVLRCNITQGRKNGIVIVDAGQGAVIESNTISQNAGHGIQIAADKSDGATMSGIELRKNTISNNVANGILIMGAGLRPAVEGNNISNSGLQPIAIEDGAQPTLANNTVQGASATASTAAQNGANLSKPSLPTQPSRAPSPSAPPAVGADPPAFPVPPPAPNPPWVAKPPVAPTPPTPGESTAAEPPPQTPRQPVMPAKNTNVPVLDPEAP